ncbi:MAG: alpha/beta hydrolase [Pseudomonadota bacterium]
MPLVAKVVLTFAVLVFAGVLLVQWRAAAREKAAEIAYPPSGEFIDVAGTQIHAKVTGQGPDLVLIHGASGSLRDFTFSIVDQLSQSYRVVAVDRPGLGWSQRPQGYGGVWNTAAEAPALQAQILRQSTDTLGVKNPIVIGHSYGGAVALAWALEYPDDTAALVLLGAASNPWEGPLDPLYQIMSKVWGGAIVVPLVTAFASHNYVDTTVAKIFTPQTPPDGFIDHFGPGMTLRRDTLRANAQQVDALKPHVRELAKDYPSIKLPVEILHGTEDDIVPIDVHSIPLSSQIPGAVLTLMDGVGHMPHHVDPDTVVAAVDRAATRAGLR